MDIANLVIAVDSTSADEAAGKLDRLSQAGARAQTATGGVTRANAAGAQSTRQFTGEMARAVQSIEAFALGAGRLQTATRGATLSTTLMGAATGALGFALASAASAAVPFITNIIESGSAARQAAEEQRYMAAASADLTRVGGELGEAQSMLGRMFDLATGRLQVQNEVVREAIRLQAILAQIDANRRGIEAGGRLAAMRPDSFFDTRGRPVSRAAAARGGALLDDSGDMTGRGGLTPNPGVSAFNRLVNSFGSNRNASVAQFRAELEALQRGGQLGGVDVNRAVIEAIQIAQNRNMIRTMQGVQAVVEGRAPLPPSMWTGGVGRGGGGARGGGGRASGGGARAGAGQADDRLQREIETLRERKLSDELARLLGAKLEVARGALEVSQGDLRIEEEIARMRGELAGTAAERRDSQLRLLDISERQERAEIDLLRLSRDAADRERAERMAASQPARSALRREQIDRDSEGPMQRYMREMSTASREMSRQIEGVQVRAFDSLADAIAGVVSGTQSLSEAFSNMARGIVSDIIQMTVRMLIFRAVSGLFGGGMGGVGASVSGIGAGLGAGLPGFANGGSFMVNGLSGDRNLLQVNGVPQALVGAGETVTVQPRRAANNNVPQQVEVHVTVSASPELDVRIEAVSARTVADAAPVIVNAAVGNMARMASRPALMGRR